MNLLGKAQQPGFWQEVREKECYKKLVDELHAIWDKHCENTPIYALKYSDFKLFFSPPETVPCIRRRIFHGGRRSTAPRSSR